MPSAALLLSRLPELVNGDAALVRAGRFLSTEFMVGIGDAPFRVTVAAGRIAGLVAGRPLLRPFSFAVRADEPAWRQFWQPLPRPGFHDLFAMTKAGMATIEGDLHPLMANLQYVKDVLAAPRRLVGEG